MAITFSLDTAIAIAAIFVAIVLFLIERCSRKAERKADEPKVAKIQNDIEKISTSTSTANETAANALAQAKIATSYAHDQWLKQTLEALAKEMSTIANKIDPKGPTQPSSAAEIACKNARDSVIAIRRLLHELASGAVTIEQADEALTKHRVVATELAKHRQDWM